MGSFCLLLTSRGDRARSRSGDGFSILGIDSNPAAGIYDFITGIVAGIAGITAAGRIVRQASNEGRDNAFNQVIG